MECWLPDAIKELRPNGEGRRKHGDNMDPGTQSMKRLPPGSSEHVLSQLRVVLFCITRSGRRCPEVTKQMIKVNLSMQFLATRPLWSVGAQSFSTWVLQTWDGEGPLSWVPGIRVHFFTTGQEATAARHHHHAL